MQAPSFTRQQVVDGTVDAYLPPYDGPDICPSCNAKLGACHDGCVAKLDFWCKTCKLMVHFCSSGIVTKPDDECDHITCDSCIEALSTHMRDYAAVTGVPLPRGPSWDLDCPCVKGVLAYLKPYAEAQTDPEGLEVGDDIPDGNPYCV